MNGTSLPPSPRVHLDLSYDAVTERFVVDGRHEGYLYEELATGKHLLDTLEHARLRWHDVLRALRTRASEFDGLSPVDAAILRAKRRGGELDKEFDRTWARSKIV